MARCKRITVKMLEGEGVWNKEDKSEFFDQWGEWMKAHGEEIFDYIIPHIWTALYADGLTDEERVKIVDQTVDYAAETLFTPKAWEIMKKDLIEELNKEDE